MKMESPQAEAARFWSKVRFGDGCWEWTASPTAAHRYGRFYGARNHYGRELWQAHRYAWVQMYGEILEGLLVCHRCDNRRCVRPDHLFLGNAKDNTLDMMAKGRLRIGKRYSGAHHYRAKLTEAQASEIKHRRACGESGPALGREFGVDSTQVYNIAKGNTWKQLAERGQ